MPVGGDDDTLASSMPTLDGGTAPVTGEGELVGGRYRILRWLGGGGMGRVYEALDTELDERVALKVLKTGLSEDAIERFRREVKLTRRIQHRNVCRMFDIGEHHGEKFLTMELVDGEPLTRRMTDKPMPWLHVKAIAEQICAGLAAAHAAGVVHRDLKPDNVLIERGTERAVLTDFGIARSGDDPSVTQVGAIVGTPRYMSPEQLAGRDVDARADLFSFGVLLFELATATRPWPGDNAIAIAVSQATVAPRTLDTQTLSLPPYFAAVLSACLQLDPRDRPATSLDVADALANARPPLLSRESVARMAQQSSAAPRRSKAPTDAPRVPATPTLMEPASVAVLPITCAPADEYLADGLLEDLIDTLSTTPGIRVRPAGIVRQTQAPDPRELGQRLHVDHVVAASLRRVPAGLRIATRLISVADGFQIWANKTDCSDAEILSVADELARGVASALSTRATSDTKPTDSRAVDLYLRARAELRRFWGSHAQQAATLLEQAVEYAPTSAPILSAAAYANVQAWVMRGEPDLLPRATAALERGLATGHGEAYLASAQYNFNCGKFEQGAADLARALVRAPMSAHSHELAGKIMAEIDGPAAARPYHENARGLDPGRAQIIENELARLDALEHKWTDADARVARLLADPDPSIQQLGTIASARLRMWRGHTELLDDPKATMARISASASAIFKMIGAIQQQGKIDDNIWNAALAQEAGADRPLRQYVVRLQLFAEIALVLGYPDKAMQAIERATQTGLLDLTWINDCPLMQSVRHTERYDAARRRVADRAGRVLAAFKGHLNTH